MMVQLTPNFTLAELACPCCGKCEMDPEFMRRVQVLRDIVGFPLVPVSGYRCRKYNSSLKGAAEDSQHLYGKAIDFRVRNFDAKTRYELIQAAFSLSFSGVGIGPVHLHLDMREGPPKMWSYKK